MLNQSLQSLEKLWDDLVGRTISNGKSLSSRVVALFSKFYQDVTEQILPSA